MSRVFYDSTRNRTNWLCVSIFIAVQQLLLCCPVVLWRGVAWRVLSYYHVYEYVPVHPVSRMLLLRVFVAMTLFSVR